jgi:hypothetical protein
MTIPAYMEAIKPCDIAIADGGAYCEVHEISWRHRPGDWSQRCPVGKALDAGLLAGLKQADEYAAGGIDCDDEMCDTCRTSEGIHDGIQSDIRALADKGEP